MLKLSFSNLIPEAGCDEAGRGCLCGPVFAAAVILPPDFKNEMLNDSKQLSKIHRDELRKIVEKEAISWAVGIVDNSAIDEINILNASILAMHQALDKLTTKPQFIIVDGNRFKSYRNIPFQCIIKGDSHYLSIAAASILAKTHRDELMGTLHAEYPIYGWNNNKGYPTLQHRQAIVRSGITPYHRKSFKMSEQLKLNL